MAKKYKVSSGIQKVKRNFMIAKTVLFITPVICYFYISLRAMMYGMDFQQVLIQEPQITIIFLIAMVNPYIAYLVHLIQQKLAQGKKTFVLVNMFLLLVAEALMLNVFYFIILAYVFYGAIKYYDLPLFSSFTPFRMKPLLFHAGGSLFVILISSICLFATIRLM